MIRTIFLRHSVVPAAIGYTDIVSYLTTSSKFPVEREYWYGGREIPPRERSTYPRYLDYLLMDHLELLLLGERESSSFLLVFSAKRKPELGAFFCTALHAV